MRSCTLSTVVGLVTLVVTSGCSDDATLTGFTAGRTNDARATPAVLVSTTATTPLTITPAGSTLAVGQTLQLVATPTGLKPRPGATVVVTWTTSAPRIATVSSTGLVSGVAVGPVTITAVSRDGGTSARGSVAVTVIARAATAPTPADTAWTTCTAAGAPCAFFGLRTVRLGGPTGPYVQQTAFGGVPCATYAFNGQNPAPGQPLHCDYGPLQTTTLANPMAAMNGFARTLTVPLGAPGATGPQVQATSQLPTSFPGEGSFRTTCSLAHFASDDPIVFPGQPGAAHLHMFFGNTSVSAASTPASLAASGNATCLGGTLNRSAYWMPAVLDPATSRAQVPSLAVIYYKSGYDMPPASIQPFPAGLRIIAGNMHAASASDQPYGIGWSCVSVNGNDATASIPNCAVGDAVRLTVIFPQCWDGRNLDLPDHKSHMAYPTYSNTVGLSRCPADHPVPLPEITEHFDFPVLPGAVPSRWRLSSDMYSATLPGGYSAHADWMLGWDPATLKTVVTQCLNASVDCLVGLLGAGQTLY